MLLLQDILKASPWSLEKYEEMSNNLREFIKLTSD